MKKKSFFVCTVCVKISFLLLLVSLFLFPRFFWKTNTQDSDLKQAIKNKESLNEYNEKGATPLIGATSQGRIDLVEKLLDAGVNPNLPARNPDDIILEAENTALHYAVLNGHYNIAKLLLDRGASVFLINKNNNTPLHTLINAVDVPLETKSQFIDLMIQKSNNALARLFNAQNKQSYTPLMRAVELKDENLVQLLLKKAKKHINFALRNNDGDTARELGLKKGADDTTVELLKKAEERVTQRK